MHFLTISKISTLFVNELHYSFLLLKCFSNIKLKSPDVFDYQGRIVNLWLTHLGSNQDSAEPKSDVLPITPWVNQTSKGAAKLEKKFISYHPLVFLTVDELCFPTNYN